MLHVSYVAINKANLMIKDAEQMSYIYSVLEEVEHRYEHEVSVIVSSATLPLNSPFHLNFAVEYT